MNKKIYIASPFGFSESGRFFMYNEVIPLLKNNSYEIIDPWRLTDPKKIDEVNSLKISSEKELIWQTLNNEIAQNNINGIKSADTILAILDGTDVDSGTASEIGFAFALNKKIIGYRSDFRLSGDNIGAKINLQVEHFIIKSGGEIVISLDKVIPALDCLC